MALWDDFMAKHPSFALNVMNTTGQRIQEAHARVKEMSTEDVEHRVAHAVLRLLRQSGRKVEVGLLVDFPVTRQDIAEASGTTLHSVSRLLSAWEEAGVVRVGRRKIVVCDLDGLTAIAEQSGCGLTQALPLGRYHDCWTPEGICLCCVNLAAQRCVVFEAETENFSSDDATGLSCQGRGWRWGPGPVRRHPSLAPQYGALSWHAHEMLFGYGSAVVSGFLLTAVPNWTGHLPVAGWRLGLLFLLWCLGRIAFLFVGIVGILPAILIDSIFLPCVVVVMGREIVVGRNWRNLVPLAMIALLAAANIGFHAEVLMRGAADYGGRATVAALVALIVLIGGRITPSFTRNWLSRAKSSVLPAPFGPVDNLALLTTVTALLLWIGFPTAMATALVFLAAAVALSLRYGAGREVTFGASRFCSCCTLPIPSCRSAFFSAPYPHFRATAHLAESSRHRLPSLRDRNQS